jgi:hypothetical protein
MINAGEIEPQFELSNIWVIFADQNSTDAILEELGIQSTCTL